jgi:deoxycitidine kinase/deoxyguanosine kinase
MSDFFKYICLSLGIPLQESKEDRIKHFVQYSQVLSQTRSSFRKTKLPAELDVEGLLWLRQTSDHSKRRSNSLRKSIVDFPIDSSTKPNTQTMDKFGDWSYQTLVDFCKTYTKPSKTCRPWIISIDGNIGAGKTTLLQKLQREVDPKRVVVVYEPVQKWTEMKDMTDEMSLLQKYYTYPHMYSFMFQTVIFQTIIQSIEEAIENHPDCDIILCERSIKSSRNVFCKMLVEDQCMTSFEHTVYESFFTPRICELYYPDHTIWLDVPIKTCLERIISRAREGEKVINLDYLQRIESLYLQERTF